MSCSTNLNELTADECRYMAWALGCVTAQVMKESAGPNGEVPEELQKRVDAILPKLRRMTAEAERDEKMRARISKWEAEANQPKP